MAMETLGSMVIFMEDMRKYFERLATSSTEDSVLQACLFNAENCRQIADYLRLHSIGMADPHDVTSVHHNDEA